jgi:hypothetical protein
VELVLDLVARTRRLVRSAVAMRLNHLGRVKPELVPRARKSLKANWFGF